MIGENSVCILTATVSPLQAVLSQVSAAMPEAWQQPWQQVAGAPRTLIEAAHVLGVKVVTSGPLLEVCHSELFLVWFRQFFETE